MTNAPPMIGDSLLPADLSWLTAALLMVTSFVGSAMTAAFSIGGGALLITVMSAVMPIQAVVPVHGLVMIGSNSGRAIILWRNIDWINWGWFAVGALIGALVGSQVVMALPGDFLRIAIAAFILFTQWGPKISMPLGKKTLISAGGISTFLTLFVGASGPFMAAVLSKVPHYSRLMLIATAGACLSLQHAIKVLVFALAGFAFGPWIPLAAACIAVGFLGTVLGAKILVRIDETVFRRGLKWALTLLAIYLILATVL